MRWGNKMTLNEKIRNNIAKGLVILTLSAGAIGCAGNSKKQENPEPVKDESRKYVITLFSENGSVISRDTVDYSKPELIKYEDGIIQSMYRSGMEYLPKNSYMGTVKVEFLVKK
jgi:hypothetical protein